MPGYNPPEVSMAFDIVFTAYPSNRRNRRAECLAIFQNMNLWQEAGAIVAGIRAAQTSAEWRREGGRFIPALDQFLQSRA